MFLLAYRANLVASDAITTDFLLFCGLAAFVALSVTVEVVVDSLVGRILLTLATLAMVGLAVMSFLAILFISSLAALMATFVAYVRPHARQSVPVR